ncbi:hypothetical protein TNCT_716071 [Trichonephila clavata]|uniref:Uncharacterized protein n=1 Tax=Trichonephila clavata TaxID=2740835 RepID=A0A8X6FAT8_TRICU|nr:hypothetical protein TNCT_716071 [Trichonephila clavata]
MLHLETTRRQMLVDCNLEAGANKTLDTSPKFAQEIGNITQALGRDVTLECVVDNLGRFREAVTILFRAPVLRIPVVFRAPVLRIPVSFGFQCSGFQFRFGLHSRSGPAVSSSGFLSGTVSLLGVFIYSPA